MNVTVAHRGARFHGSRLTRSRTLRTTKTVVPRATSAEEKASKAEKVPERASQEALVTSLPLSMATLFLSTAPSYAEEAAVEAAKDTSDVMSQSSGILGYTNGGLVIAFSPIVIYAVFYLYRATINPKAKLQDLLFIAAFCVVVANILSIVVFHRRIY